MRLRLPSLQALLVFEASARCLSFTRAAAELHVTPVAVSRMVARLEDTLAIPLFTRSKAGLILTDDGQTLQAAVAAGFGQVSDAIEAIKRRREGGESVTLSISSGIAAQWLLPRHQRFHATFPTVNLRLQVAAGPLQGPLDGADLGIRLHGAGAAHDALHFCPELIMAVCSPGYLAGRGSLDASRGAEGHTLIHLEPTTHGWSDYFGLTGIRADGQATAVGYSDPGLALQGAMLGQGILLGWMQAVAAPLNAGAVVPASTRLVETGAHYGLEFGAREPSAATRQVAQWLIAEMADELARIQPMLADMMRVRRPQR